MSMNDSEFRDHCAAAAISGLVTRYADDPDTELRHHYHLICIEAFRLAEEMVEQRHKIEQRAGQQNP